MTLRLANTPVSWGVHYADDDRNLPWPDMLDALADSGFRWIELGPIGYLPEDAGVLREELARRRLGVVATYVHEPLGDPRERERVLELARRGCRLLTAVGGKSLVIIDQRVPERIATAGRSDVARRIDDDNFVRLVDGIERVAEVAREHDIVPVLHPHVAGYIEFRDEIDRFLDALDSHLVRLCIDTGHSAYAGIDPVGLYRDYRDRIEYLHFKDINRDVHGRVVRDGVDFDTAMLEGVFCPLGEGVVDFHGLKTALEETGYDGWACVEQDHEPRDPNRMSRAAEGAKRSLDFLTRVGLGEQQTV